MASPRPALRSPLRPAPGPHDHPSPAATPAPVTTNPTSGGLPSPSRKLSPCAEPFFPAATSGGRGKRIRWLDESGSDSSSCGGSPRPSYRDILLSNPPPPTGFRSPFTPSHHPWCATPEPLSPWRGGCPGATRYRPPPPWAPRPDLCGPRAPTARPCPSD
nr:vegetative cell wall protein gp1-like [Setaria viridis]